MTEFIQVFTTVDSKENAEKMAKILLEEKLAGCVQIIGPITSFYWWEDKIEKSEEWLLIIKSREGIYEELEKMIKNHHPYEVPEIISIKISGNKEYLNWLKKYTIK